MRRHSLRGFIVSCLALAACGTPFHGGDASGVDVNGIDVPPPLPGNAPIVAGCRIFPNDNPWNTDVSTMPVSPNSAAYIAAMSPSRGMHPDWGNWSTDAYGIPWNSGTGAPAIPMNWSASWGATESDMHPCPSGGGNFCYPIPSTAKIEGNTGASSGSDRHLLYIDTAGAPEHCTLYEVYNAQNWVGPGWTAANGAIFPLDSNTLRPDQWTSADAAGLSVFAGLVRVDEVLAGEIRHAIRFTMNNTANSFIHPATHGAGGSGANLPPMGLRVRLRASFDTTPYSGPSLVILTAMKRYGMILADNGSDWYFSGDSDDRWDPMMDALLTTFRAVHGSDFEVVDTGTPIPVM